MLARSFTGTAAAAAAAASKLNDETILAIIGTKILHRDLLAWVTCACRLEFGGALVALAAVAAERKAGAGAAAVILHAHLLPASPAIVVVVLVHCMASAARRGMWAIHAAARGLSGLAACLPLNGVVRCACSSGCSSWCQARIDREEEGYLKLRMPA